jgi:hypothetical protein
MYHQDWESLTIHGKNQKKRVGRRDADKSKKLMKLRTQILKLTMRQIFNRRSIARGL